MARDFVRWRGQSACASRASMERLISRHLPCRLCDMRHQPDDRSGHVKLMYQMDRAWVPLVQAIEAVNCRLADAPAEFRLRPMYGIGSDVWPPVR
jgi:hypothetical protein